MSSLHEEKPPVSARPSSLFIDLVFWNPKDDDPRPLQRFLEEHHLGERSQNVFWLNKITTRLAMWRGQYWYFLDEDGWREAARDVEGFIRKTVEHYQIKRVDYDTRAFSVGLQAKARHQKKPLAALVEGRPAHGQPVWWTLEW